MSEYLEMSEETQKRYDQKNKYLYEYLEEVKKDNISYEPLLNIPIAKNIIKIRFKYNLDDEEDINETGILESAIVTLFQESLKAIEKKSVYEFIMSSYYDESSKELKKLIEKNLSIDYGNYLDNQLKQYKYLIVSDNHLPYLKFIENKNTDGMYFGEYKGIKIYVLEELENMYFMNNPIVDLNNLNISYHDTLDSEIENEEVFDSHKGIITLNSIMGDIDVIEIECKDGTNAKNKFQRYLKLKRLIKNEG